MGLRTQGQDRPRHFVAEMDLTEFLPSRTRSLVTAPLTDAVRAPGGGPAIGVLISAFDLGASHPAMIACRPDWTATQDLAMHGAGPLRDGPIVIDSRLVRAGKKVVVVAGHVYDGHGVGAGGTGDLERLAALLEFADPARPVEGLTLAASGLLTFARIPRTAAAGMADYDPSNWVGQIRPRADPPAAPGTSGTVYERLGLRAVDAAAGALELDRTPYVTNSIGTIVGGAQATMLEAAAQAMRPGMVATDMQLHFLSQIRSGPARTSGTVLRDAPGHSVVSLLLTDAGSDDQLLCRATVTLQPVQPAS